MKTTRKSVNATEFKAKCLKFLDKLGPEGMVITKRGRPIARVTPITADSNARIIGSMKGKIAIKGDLFTTGVKWRAQPRSVESRPPQRRPAAHPAASDV